MSALTYKNNPVSIIIQVFKIETHEKGNQHLEPKENVTSSDSQDNISESKLVAEFLIKGNIDQGIVEYF